VIRWVALLVLVSFPAMAGPCDALGGSEMIRAELYFGWAHVPDREWVDFLVSSVTPRFPDGLTALDGRGQWRDPRTQRIGREASTVLVIVAPMADDLRARLDAVRGDYKARFHQQSVGLVTEVVCAGF